MDGTPLDDSEARAYNTSFHLYYEQVEKWRK